MSNRKVILKMVLSLDGFATSPDGTHEWMFEWFGEDSTERSLRELEDAGIHAMGRRSYEIMGPHWAASEGPIAVAMNDKPKAVFSHTLKNAEWGPAEIFGGDLSAEIADLKARDDEGTVLVHGGRVRGEPPVPRSRAVVCSPLPSEPDLPIPEHPALHRTCVGRSCRWVTH